MNYQLFIVYVKRDLVAIQVLNLLQFCIKTTKLYTCMFVYFLIGNGRLTSAISIFFFICNQIIILYFWFPKSCVRISYRKDRNDFKKNKPENRKINVLSCKDIDVVSIYEINYLHRSVYRYQSTCIFQLKYKFRNKELSGEYTETSLFWGVTLQTSRFTDYILLIKLPTICNQITDKTGFVYRRGLQKWGRGCHAVKYPTQYSLRNICMK